MKSFFRSLVAATLAMLARGVLRKYKPMVVMVTGSVGKTSTKDAVAAVLSEAYHLRASEKSYNSEFGVPLTIIGAKNPWNDPYKWIAVFEEALALILLPSHYPKLLVLEVGADRPGDLRHILKIATPDAVVVTRLPDVPVHVEAYASPQAVRDEEFAPAYALPTDAPLIVSADDCYASKMAAPLPVQLVTFGFSESADVRLEHPDVLIEQEELKGMRATLHTSGGSHGMSVEGALGLPQLYAPAAAVALARALGVDDKAIARGVATYVPPPGRCCILRGRDGATLIDDSYNASPAAVEEVLNVLTLVPHITRRIAVIGDMLELGRYSVEQHERIGRLAAEKVSMVVAVGIRARAIAEAARKAGMSEEHALMFDTAQDAATALKEQVGKGDLVLIKGSQSIRMERVTAALLADPADASKLVRQERQWKRRA